MNNAINTSADENKEFVEEIKDRLSDLKDGIEKMSVTEKKNKNANETLNIIKKILDYIKDAQKIFHLVSKVGKRKSEPKQKSDRSIPKWVQVSEDRFNFIKLKINEKKDLATMIGNKRYILNYVNELVNKIAKQKIGKNNAIKAYNNLVDKAKKIAELRSTPHRQKMLEIFNYLREIFNGQTDGEGLKILAPNQMLSRLAITLAQLKAKVFNSEKLKNEIRLFLYSLYRSKKLTKQFYKSLVDII